MKGFSFQPLNHPNSQKPHLAVWEKWRDVKFPRLRFALKGGGVPNVVGKAALLCTSNLARIYKEYTWKWWLRPFATIMA